MDENNILGIIALVISISGVIFGFINHKRLRSRCNDNKIEASIDVDNTSPLINK
jgi:hypothetical protein